MPEITETLYVTNAKEWRTWLEKNYQSKNEIWLILPHKATGKPKILYNDSVEEALCFGWIDSTVKRYGSDASAQRFTPRKNKAYYSQQNKERLRFLAHQGKLLPEVEASVRPVLNEKFVFPKDIIDAIKANEEAWKNFQRYSEAYRRIRVAYINELRSNPEEFQRRLNNLIAKTAANKQIGYGGIDKYY